MKIDHEIKNYVIARINNEFPEDIDTLVCYGSYVNGTANAKSDIDMYFIPRTEKGYELAETFILKGIGYDIFPMSWERLDKIANIQDGLSPLIGDVKILYSYSDQETQKFSKLQQRMNLHFTDNAYMANRAYDRAKNSLDFYHKIMGENCIGNIRENAGFILMLLSEAVAYMNGAYFHKGLKGQYEDLKNFDKKPKKYLELYEEIISENDSEQLKEKCFQIIVNTIKFIDIDKDKTLEELHAYPSEVADNENAKLHIDYECAAQWYQEAISTFNKIEVCTENNDYILAFLSACCLQQELKMDCDLQLKTKDLLGEYCHDNLKKLLLRTREIEQDCVNQIQSNGVKIRRVDSLEELK